MSTISSLVPKQLDQSALSGNSQPENSYTSLALKAARVTASTSFSKDIAIETDEGDKVTLSYKNDTSFQAASYDAFYQRNSLVSGENGDLMCQQTAQSHTDIFSYSQETQFPLSIEGDLSEQERKDIREALEIIDKLMMDTLQGGDLLKAAQDAAKILELESIDTVDADYRYQSLITIEEMTQVSSVSNYGDAEALEGTPSRLELPERSSTEERVQELIERMAEFIEEWAAEKKLKTEHFLRPVEKLFADHLGKLEDDPEAQAQQELFKYLGKGLLEQIRDMSEPELV
ncbi:MAG: hypothetical protein J7L25_13555 [Deltaproteobacteria bacterium]|nr:hypothetical protein [Candidatus Tharpella aukensis]